MRKIDIRACQSLTTNVTCCHVFYPHCNYSHTEATVTIKGNNERFDSCASEDFIKENTVNSLKLKYFFVKGNYSTNRNQCNGFAICLNFNDRLYPVIRLCYKGLVSTCCWHGVFSISIWKLFSNMAAIFLDWLWEIGERIML